jgi:ATP-dependent Lon protease
LSADISTRDRDGIQKTFSGMMKILFPHGEATPAEIEEVLRFSIEGRKRVKDQLLRIDTTYAKVRFTYQDKAGKEKLVTTLEEDEYAGAYHRAVASGSDTLPPIAGGGDTAAHGAHQEARGCIING